MSAGARVWLAGARPRTLGASIVPVVVGTALARSPSAVRGALALTTAVGLQVGVNYLNDYFDGVRGVDTADRAGPLRLTASGTVAPARVASAGTLALVVAALSGVTLSLLADPRLLLVGLLFLAAAVLYSGGPRPYASAGLGEAVVFATFGLGAVAGTAYAHDGVVRAAAWWCGTTVGLLAVAIMLVNNIRDIPTDRAAGKRTLAVRLGERASRTAYRFTLAASVAIVVGAAAGGALPGRAAVVVVTLPLVAVCARDIRARGRALVATLQRTALLHLAHGALLAWAVWHA